MDSGTLTLNSNGSFTYAPNNNFSGTDSFTYRACDGPGSCSAPATVTITVTPVNDAPVAVNDSVGTLTYLGNSSLFPLTNDTDSETPNSALRISTVTQPINGTVTISADRKKLYLKRNPGATGPFSFSYTILDEDGAKSAPATVTGTFK